MNRVASLWLATCYAAPLYARAVVAVAVVVPPVGQGFWHRWHAIAEVPG